MKGMISTVGEDTASDRHETPRQPLTWSPVSLEAEILAVLDRPAPPGEQLAFAFRRKEAELAEVCGRLSVIDARQLHRRVTLLLPEDPITPRMKRLIPERRMRLLRFLGDARRREAVRNARNA